MVNEYFSNDWGVSSEQDLAADLVDEVIEMKGKSYYYIPRTTGNIDELLNEAPLSSFNSFTPVTLWLQNFDGLTGNNTLLTKFGLDILTPLTFVVAKRRFQEEVQAKPLSGDLLYDPLSKLMIEISKCDDEPPMSYQLEKNYTYTLYCKIFNSSYEDMATGIPEVDAKLDPSTFVSPFDKAQEISDIAHDEQDFSEKNPFGVVPGDE